MGRGVDGLHAAALIDGHVNDNAALAHWADHLARDQPRRARAFDEHAADDQIGVLHRFGDVVGVGGHGGQTAV